MQKTVFLLLCIIAFGCSNNRAYEYDDTYQQAFDSILRSNAMRGTIVILDPQTKTYYSNDFQHAKTRFLPASTFKIPHSIIALETNVIASGDTQLQWDGQERDFDSWERDMTVREAFQSSCVPCFQVLAREIGEERMRSFLNKLRYGHMNIQGDVDSFWLRGSSSISPLEQIDFLARLYDKKLPILTTTREKVIKLMEIERNSAYIFGGKSGLSYQDDEAHGWFVGTLTIAPRNYYFALHAEPMSTDTIDNFILRREQAVRSALVTMGLIKKN